MNGKVAFVEFSKEQKQVREPNGVMRVGAEGDKRLIGTKRNPLEHITGVVWWLRITVMGAVACTGGWVVGA